MSHFQLPPPEARFYQIDEKPLSLNEAYATMQGRSKNGSWKNNFWRRKTAEAWMYQWLIQDTMAWYDLMDHNGSKLTIPCATHLQGMSLMMVFYIPPKELRVQDHSKFKGRDVSNYVKLLEDAVFEYLARTDGKSTPEDKAKIPDAANLDLHTLKRQSWDNDWHVRFYVGNQSFADQEI